MNHTSTPECWTAAGESSLLTDEGTDHQRANTGFEESFQIAKKALEYVGRFRLPPTPNVFEVLYRYAEGKDSALKEQVSCLLESGRLSLAKVQELYQQFCAPSNSVLQQELSDVLAQQMGGLQSLLGGQLAANGEFKEQVRNAETRLIAEDCGQAEISECITTILDGNTTLIQKMEAMKSQLEESQRQVHSLRENLSESEAQVHRDPLTGIGNRRFFDVCMAQVLREARDCSGKFFLLLVDLDNFKSVNDCYGHNAGDEVLCFAAHSLQALAGEASIARFGGDEFAIFYQDNGCEEAGELAFRICRYFSEHSLQTGDAAVGKITISIGGSRLRVDDDRDSWFQRADKLLYDAKSSGRNCAMIERTL